jgi:hypothetical protein
MNGTLQGMRGCLRRALSAGAVIGALVLPDIALGQAVTGTIVGTVTDSTGAALPGVTVTVTHQETGLARTVVTDDAGEYVVPSIPTGNYSVSSELTGFKKTALTNLHLGVDQRLRVDLNLELGQMTESVEIVAAAPLVQTDSSDLSTTVDEEQIKTLPLNGRNFVSLTRTVPGVTRGIPGANIDGAGSLAWRASASFSANGQRPRDNNFLLDGVDNNETWLQTVVIFPSVDALDEFKLQTSTYAAEFGRSLGGVVNLQIKSGSNSLRGSAFEFLRDDRFDATNFFLNRADRDKPSFEQHQFGGTLGGPVLQGRTFFFGDYQGFRVKQGQTYLSTVPSMAMREGNFSEINRVIYDPLTNQPFEGNIVPQSRWDPASRNVLQQLYPEPNTTGDRGANGQQINNYLITPTLEREDNQFDVKVDHNLSTNNRFFTRYSYQKTHRLLPATLPHGDAGFTFGAGDGNIKAQGLAFNDTHTFTDRWLNEFRFGWTQIKFLMSPIDFGQNLAQQVGIPNINLNDVTSAMSQITFGDGGIRQLGSNGNQPLITNQNDFQIFDNVTYIRGRHAFKAGGSITLREREILNADLIVGQFRFDNDQTSNCAGITTGCTPNPSTGFDVASFLLGYANQKDRRLFDATTYTETRPEFALYVQDDFRATNKLTLNLGLRWDVFPPWIEVDDRQSNFDPSTGKFVVASEDAVIDGVNVGRYLQTYSKGNLGPRFGASYDVFGTGRTLVRGGWGMFWNFTPGGTSSSKAQNPPFLQSTTLSTGFGTNLRLSDGLPPPPGVDPNRPPAGSTRSIFDINFRDAYSQNWNLNVQQQFGTNYMVEVAYVGARGRQMFTKGNPNQAPPVVGITDPNVNRPYAQLSPALRDVGMVQSNGTLDYHGLLLKFQRRFANNFSVLNSYTYSKTIDVGLGSNNDGNVTFINVYEPLLDRGPADYDLRHSFSSAWIYELPWARQQWYGGWMVNGILYLRSGYPFTVTQTANVASVGGPNGNRPNRICDGSLDNPTIDRWFDTSCFVPPADTTGTFGDSGRNILRGPGQFNIDMSLAKTTRFGRVETEFRVEAFNLLNHPQFAQFTATGAANTQIGNASVGRITTMLSNPACSLCGTTERQIQFAMKVRF